MDYSSLRESYDSSSAYDRQVEMEALYDEYSIAIDGIEATKDGMSKRCIDKEYTTLAKECLSVDCKHLRWEILRLGDGVLFRYVPMNQLRELYREVKDLIHLL